MYASTTVTFVVRVSVTPEKGGFFEGSVSAPVQVWPEVRNKAYVDNKKCDVQAEKSRGSDGSKKQMHMKRLELS